MRRAIASLFAAFLFIPVLAAARKLPSLPQGVPFILDFEPHPSRRRPYNSGRARAKSARLVQHGHGLAYSHA